MSAGEIFVGSVAVGIVPSAQGFAERIREQVVPSANSAGDEWGTIFAARIREKMRGALNENGRAAIDVDVDTTKAKAEIEALKKSAGDSGGASGDSFGSNFISRLSAHFRGKNIMKDVEDAAGLSGDRSGQNFASKFLSRLTGRGGSGGLLSGVFSSAAADAAKEATKAGSTAGDAVSQGLLESIKSNPWIMSGVGAAIAVATPLIAQAMAGMLVFGLGAGIAAMAIYGASHAKSVVAIFDKLKTDINKDLTDIGKSFVPVLDSILSTAIGVLAKLTPIFAGAARVIAGPFKEFADTLLKTFESPAVKTSIEAIAGAFGKLLTALSPTLAADVNAVAKGITNVASAVAKNPAAFAGFITFMIKIVVACLDLIAALTNVASYMEKQWAPMWTHIGGFVTGVWRIIVATVKTVTGEIIDLVKIFAALFTGNWTALWNAVKAFFTVTWNGLKAMFLPILNWFKNTSDATWNSIFNVIKSVWNAVLSFFRAVGAAMESLWNSVWNAIKNTIGAALNWINNTVRSILNSINGFWRNLWNDVFNFMKGIWNDIGNDVKSSLDWISGTFDNIMGTIHNDWNTFWGGIKNIASSAWTWVTQNLGKFLNGMQLAFAASVKAIGSIWNGVKAVAAAPVSFIVNTVYNGGIVKVVDAISGVFGVKALSPISLPKGFAKGTGGAPPGWAWVGEEGPELVNMTGGETVLTSAQSMATGLWGHGVGFATGTAQPGAPTGDGKAAHGKPRAIDPSLLPGPISIPNPITLIEHGFDAAVKGLRDLTGDALAAGMNAIVNPLINKIPGLNTGWGQYLKRDITKFEGDLVNYIKGVSEAAGGSGNAASIAAFAETFNGHKYVFGGPSNPNGGWDCSSFVSYVLGHFNIGIPGGSWKSVTNNGSSHGPVAGQYKTWSGGTNKSSQNVNNIEAGDLLTWDTHVGFGSGKNQMFSAYSTAQGTIYTPATAGPTGEKLLIRTINAAQGGGSGPLGGATGSEMANGRELFQYLMANLFENNKIAAAGAIASIWGESTWNPFAAGTGGRGLIGWTPPGTISDAAFRGGMRTQEPAIIQFVGRNGDMSAIQEMMRAGSVLAAANIWGKGVERYGINDVHAEGLALAKQIAGLSIGTRGAAPGWAWVGENGPELVNMQGGETVLTHEQSLSALSQDPGRGYWMGTTGTSPMEQGVAQFSPGDGKSNSGVERKLDQLIKATKGVGGDVAGNLNATGRVAGNRSNFNNRR